MKIEIIYEDKDIVVINKPAGIVVNDAQTASDETIQSWFYDRNKQFKELERKNYKNLIPDDFDDTFGSPEEIFVQRQGIVHRLDKETSGILLLAKNPGSLVNLLAQFKKRQTKKKYLCLAHGKFGVEKDLISAPVGRSTQNRTKFRVDVDGREATTLYEVKEFFPEINYSDLNKVDISESDLKVLKKNKSSYQGFSLVECWPKTGRTHQIRVHMAHIKHPLVGDKVYLGKKRVKLDPLWCERHFLHASQLTFVHPYNDKEITFSAQLTNDLKVVLQLLDQGE